MLVYPYQPVGWTEGVSSLGPVNLNHMDEAIRAASDIIPLAANVRRIVGLSLGSRNYASMLVWDEGDTVYLRTDTAFGKLSLTTGVYTALASFPVASMQWGKLMKLDNDRIAVMASTSGTDYIRPYIYTISANAWATKAALNYSNILACAAAVNPADGFCYVTFSWGGGSGVQKFDHDANTWSLLIGDSGSSPTDAGFLSDGSLITMTLSSQYTYWTRATLSPWSTSSIAVALGVDAAPSVMATDGMKVFGFVHRYTWSTSAPKVTQDWVDVADFASGTVRRGTSRGLHGALELSGIDFVNNRLIAIMPSTAYMDVYQAAIFPEVSGT